MQNFKWKDQMETPLGNLITEDVSNEINDKFKKVKFSFFHKMMLITWVVFVASIMIGLAIWMPFPSIFHFDLKFEYTALFLIFFGFTGIGISYYVKHKTVVKVKDNLNRLELFQNLIKDVDNISLTEFSKGIKSDFVKSDVKFDALKKQLKQNETLSYCYKGKFNENEIEILNFVFSKNSSKIQNVFGKKNKVTSIVVKNAKAKNFQTSFKMSSIKEKENALNKISFDDFTFDANKDELEKLISVKELEKISFFNEKLKSEWITFESKNDHVILSFPTPKGFMDPLIKITDMGKFDLIKLKKDLNKDVLEFLDYLSYVSCIKNLEN